MNNRIFFILLATFILFGCSNSDHDHTHDPVNTDQHEDEMVHAEDELSLTAVQIANIGIKYSQITQRSLKSTVRINGRVELPPDGKAVSTSPLDGQITEISIREGQYVTSGQPLFTIRNLELIDWQESFRKSAATLEYLDKEIERQKFLSEEQIAPLKQLQSLEAERKKVLIEMDAIKKRLTVVGLDPESADGITGVFTVNAPHSGIIQHLQVYRGTYVDTQTELVEIINNSHLRIHLFAYAGDMQYLKEGQRIEFFVQSRPAEVRQAKIAWINKLVNEENNSYEIHADIAGELKTLSPGEFVEARVINSEALLPSLPMNAITFDKGLSYIFVREEEGEGEEEEEAGMTHFVKIHIKTGESDLGFIEISPVDPIPENASVVTEGAFFLMAQSKKGEGGGGHAH